MNEAIYIHKHQTSPYVFTHGISFREFSYALPQPLAPLLLLKSDYPGGIFHMHTLHAVVLEDELDELRKEKVDEYSDFCWIDVEDTSSLDELSPEEIAELLYLGHMKQPLRKPFLNTLRNRFVYLSHNDGHFNKTYYRDWQDFYGMLSVVFSEKISKKVQDKWVLPPFRKASKIRPVTLTLWKELESQLEEGALISLSSMEVNRIKVTIPIYVVGDYVDIDQLFEDFEPKKYNPIASLVYHRKSEQWAVT
ncbi:hypothetical protein [Bacillus fonticola]|uniref:hypothetical protein n=1 Tax=Bacillus fonticola TaxID=2728853 RepID=UPI00147559A7|nr:hypothetical protein [Bacillus fonticola]